MARPSRAQTVVVTGDLTLDWNLARSAAPAPGGRWGRQPRGRLSWQRGGAALLADLVAAAAAEPELGNWRVLQRPAPAHDAGDSGLVSPQDPRFHHSFASWCAYPREPESREVAWRVQEFLGLTACAESLPAEVSRVPADDPEAALVVLDDLQLGFREQENLWPVCLVDPGRTPWVVLKMARPVAEGPLWDRVCERHAERTVAVVAVDDLRLSQVHIGRELSWERTAQDLAWEVVYSRGLSGLDRCAYVVVSFGAAGAFVYSAHAAAGQSCRLIFDPRVVEGMWERARPGRMVGSTTCLAAAIAREIMLAPDSPDIGRAAVGGIEALRALHRHGYGDPAHDLSSVELRFPTPVVLEAMRQGSSELHECVVPMPTGERSWTILGERYRGDLQAVATQVVLRGPRKVLQGVPLGSFGALLTVDRQEIESLRSIRSLINEYVSKAHPARPLSIAVFGPPGSGKSFAITELARALRGDEIQKKEFNLSQLASPRELLSALHQVRDIGLGGKLPLVFWDEFDTEHEGAYGWLRYFLAPMQDGAFQEGDVVHPIGRAIFVFAGGTSERLQAFGGNVGEEEARRAKVPDFVSRLKGYLNVMGPNPTGPGDSFYLLRRAILLRSMLERSAGHLLDEERQLRIDPGVLRALLLTRTFRHGARSMESVLAMSMLAGHASFERSALPTEAQLDLHVDGQEFLALTEQLELRGELLERLARAAHDLYREHRHAQGWIPGPALDRKRKRSPSLVEFDQLPPDKQEQNRCQVLDYPVKLAMAGCYMVPVSAAAETFAFRPDVLELLARREHERWLLDMLQGGWRYERGRNDDVARLHGAMVPWDDAEARELAAFADRLGPAPLPEREKTKDRAAVEDMIAVLARTGFTIVQARHGVPAAASAGGAPAAARPNLSRAAAAAAAALAQPLRAADAAGAGAAAGPTRPPGRKG